MSKKKTTNEFISEAISIHGNKYNYSKVEYHGKGDKVCIICPEHGEFWQTPEKHLSGQGCPLCSKTMKGNNDSFVKKAICVHGCKYDYSKVNYINNREKVCIICPEHGEFWQDPHNHLKGKGCPECGKEINKPKKYTTKSFISEAIKIHGNKYDYSQSEYVDMNTKVKIICPIHGEFFQTPYVHLNGSDCPKCSHISLGIERRSNKEIFIDRAKEIHGDKYDYSSVNYITAKHKVLIKCPIHGDFWQTPDKHIQGNGCPKCTQPFSKNEMEILDFIKRHMGDNSVVEHDRSILNGKELDIFIPSINAAIEYNGLYWHTKDKNYHLLKSEECEKHGIKLIQIFEDEYIHNKEIVLSKILHIIKNGNYTEKVMGRKCSVIHIGVDDAKNFLSKNHIQGFAAASVHFAAMYNNDIVAVMSFKKEKDSWELVRYASKLGTLCQGVGGKLLSAFIKEYDPLKIKSFADRRWTINKDNIYTKIGFEFDGYVPPDYKYYNPRFGTIRYHKFGFRKQILHKKYGLPLTMTESEMTAKLGYSKIYDCGLIRYVWTKKAAD